MVRNTARLLGLPTTIARLNLPYSDTAGWPLMHLHSAVPATIVNWAVDEPVGVAEWTRYLGELVGREVTLPPTDYAIKGVFPAVLPIA